ncbi:MAG: MarR family winged helix-turn-helix transcriptional regulator [Acidimicrobiales bacterium]
MATDVDETRTTEQLAEQLIAVNRLLGATSRRADVAGLSNARYELLHGLVHGGPSRMGVIARQAGVSPRTVTPMVDALEADGLVTRTTDAADRRAQVVTLTPAGLRRMRTAHNERIAMAAEIFETLTAGERTALGGLLGKVLRGGPP